MTKTKLGITVGLMGAVVALSPVVFGFTVMALAAGYVLIAEENAWLKRLAVKVVVIVLAFGLLTEVLDLLPNLISVFNSFASAVGLSFSLSFVTNIMSGFIKICNLVKTVLLVIMGVLALKQTSIPIPFVDKMFEDQ